MLSNIDFYQITMTDMMSKVMNFLVALMLLNVSCASSLTPPTGLKCVRV